MIPQAPISTCRPAYVCTRENRPVAPAVTSADISRSNGRMKGKEINHGIKGFIADISIRTPCHKVDGLLERMERLKQNRIPKPKAQNHRRGRRKPNAFTV